MIPSLCASVARELVRWGLAELVLSALFFLIVVGLFTRLSHPRERYLCLKLWLVAILFLPFVPGLDRLGLPVWLESHGTVVDSGGTVIALPLVRGETSWLPLALAAIYVLGLLALGARRLRSYLQLKSLMASAHRLPGTTLPVWLVDTNVPPITVGVFSPRVLVSRAIFAELDQTEREIVLRHEEAHLSCGDVAWNGWRLLVQDLLFFSPFAHWLCRRFEEEMELSVDQRLLQGEGKYEAIPARAYGQLLFKLACRNGADETPLVQGVFLTNHFLRMRLSKMKAIPSKFRSWRSWCVAMAATATGLCLLSLLGMAANGPARVQGATSSGESRVLVVIEGEKQPALGGHDLLSAETAPKCQQNCPLYLSLRPEAVSRFSELTATHVGKKLAIELSGKYVAGGTIKTRILGPKFMLTGNLSSAEARDAAQEINASLAP